MLNSLRIGNYKSFAKLTSVPLGRLNILLGKNNSGKTSMARLPLLIAGAFAERRTTSESQLSLVANGLRFGSEMQELSHGQQPHGEIAFGFDFQDLAGYPSSVDFRVQLSQSIFGANYFVSSFDGGTPATTVHWDQVRPNFGDVKYDPPIFGFQGVLPQPENSEAFNELSNLRDRIMDRLGTIEHLTSVRSRLPIVFESRSASNSLDSEGAEAPFMLASSSRLERAVSEWYEHTFGVVRLDVEAEANSFRLAVVSPLGDQINLAHSGQGLQQVLPVATYLLDSAITYSRNKLVIVEEPELHLHPAAHGAVADLFARAANAEFGPQLFVETHSENFVLRLRRKVATGELDPSLLNILWFDQDQGQTTVRRIEVNLDGSVSNWPRGIFSEDLLEVRAITAAKP